MTRFVRLTVTDFARLVDSFPWKRGIRAVHVHHTWRPSHRDWQGLQSVEAMWRFHTRTNGWSDLAQHATIDPEGFVWTGRNWNQPPASARSFNGDSLAGPFMIETVGDFDHGRDVFGGGQKETLLKATAWLLDKFELGIEAVRFHNEMSAKSCPGTGIDRLSFLAEVAARRGERAAGARRARGDGDALTYDKQSLEAVRKLIEGGPVVNEPADVEPDDGVDSTPAPMAARAARTASPRAALSSADRLKLRQHVINSRNGVLGGNSGQFATSEAEVHRIFAEHIKKFAGELGDRKPLRLMFFAHGGLVDEEAGLAIALRQIDWWLANDVYPVFFVWETGLLETIGQMLSRNRELLPGGRALDWSVTNGLIEAAAHHWGGVALWSQMKHAAAQGMQPGGATDFAVRQLHQLLAEIKDRPVELHAVGHSAGSIFHSWFVPAVLKNHAVSFKTLSLLAPAIRIDEFKARLQPVMGKQLDQLTIFTMAKDFELDDSLLGIYGKSLLYMIYHALEPEERTPILGLDESLHADRDMRPAFGLSGESSAIGGSVIWSRTAAGSGPNASQATTHGGFDDDPATMNAVLRRVLRLNHEPLAQEFTGVARDLARTVVLRRPIDDLPPPWPERLAAQGWTDLGPAPSLAMTPPPSLPSAPATFLPSAPAISANGAAGGRRRALCIGINSYPTAPLLGCVADAQLWARTLAQQGFETATLLEDAARRDSILGQLRALIETSRAGDHLVLQYSGHGTQLEDPNSDEDEDGKDEAICPIDFAEGAFVVDDDFAELFAGLPDGVALTCFFDCCHSGTNTRLAVGPGHGARPGSRARYLRATPEMNARHRAFRGGGRRVASRSLGRNQMRQVVFSACRSDEVAWESEGQGDFTRVVVPLLGSSVGRRHRDVLQAILDTLGPNRRQSPELDCADAQYDTPLFGAGAGDGGRSLANGGLPHGNGLDAAAYARLGQSLVSALRGIG